jgi:FMN phosphatase YigB (HAD superfamily)
LPYRDARRVVTTLKHGGFKLGLVSNVGFDLRPILRRHGFEALADTCTLSYEHGVAKPDAGMSRPGDEHGLEQVLRLVGFAP